MPEPVDLRQVLDLAPARAIEYFRAKGYRITFNWDDMEAAAHARAFTVAKATNLEVLQAIRGELDRALAEGISLQSFQKALEPRLKALGWWGKQVLERPDGTAQLVQTGSPFRLKTIYQTNLQSAYMAGRYRDMMQNVDDRPYWQYVAVMDASTRPAHAAMNGRVFRFDDPIWKTCYPPNGYNCRCRVRALSRRDMESKGLAAPESGEHLASFEDADPSTGAIFERVSYKAPGMTRAFAPDRGFAGNPALEAWQPELERYPRDLRSAYLDDALDGPAFELFMKGDSDETFPMALAGDRLGPALDADAEAVVRFTSGSRDKNVAHHGELTLDDYRFARTVIERSQIGALMRDTHIALFLRRGDADWWVAVVKRTKIRDALYLVSYRRTNASDMSSLLSRARILWGETDER